MQVRFVYQGHIYVVTRFTMLNKFTRSLPTIY